MGHYLTDDEVDIYIQKLREVIPDGIPENDIQLRRKDNVVEWRACNQWDYMEGALVAKLEKDLTTGEMNFQIFAKR